MIPTPHYKDQLVTCVILRAYEIHKYTDGKMTNVGSIHSKHNPKWLVIPFFYPYHHRASCF